MFREVAEFSGVLGFCRIGNSLTHAVDRALIIEDIRAMFLGCCFFFSDSMAGITNFLPCAHRICGCCAQCLFIVSEVHIVAKGNGTAYMQS